MPMQAMRQPGAMEAGNLLPMNESSNYTREWRAYRYRRNLALFLLFGLIPVCVGGFFVSRLYLHLPVLMLTLMFVWFAVMCWSIWYAGEFRCPRCRRRFGALGSKKGFVVIWRGLFDKICYNCKLRKFENG